MQHPLDLPLAQLRRTPRLTFRTRLVIAAAIILASIAGATYWTSKHSSVLPVLGKWQTKRLPELGIQFSYPTSWHLQDIHYNLTMTVLTGALVSNVDHGFEHPEGTSAYDMRGLDDGVVVLSFQQLDRFNTEGKETVGFPLSLDRAEEVVDANTYGAPQPRYTIYFGVEGYLRSAVQVWIGDVTPEEGTAIERILASVQPLSP